MEIDHNKTGNISPSLLSESIIAEKMKRRAEIARELKKTQTAVIRLEKHSGPASGGPNGKALESCRIRHRELKEELERSDLYFSKLRQDLEDEIKENQKRIVPFKDTFLLLSQNIERKRKLLLLLSPCKRRAFKRSFFVKSVLALFLIGALSGAAFTGLRGVSGYWPFSAKAKEGASLSTEAQVIYASPQEEIGVVFEIIREANLRKNLALYTSCFSQSFAGLEARRKMMMRNWSECDFAGLSYSFRNFAVKGDNADLIVDWQMDVRFPKKGGRHLLNASNHVRLLKEDGAWKIAFLQ